MLQSDGYSYLVNSSVPNSYSFLYRWALHFSTFYIATLDIVPLSDCLFVDICLFSWLLFCYVVLVCITLHIVTVITSAIGPLSCPCV
jgi:hypothetical protein